MAVHGAAPPAPLKDVRLDGPFLFLIADRVTGCVLLLGRVADHWPTSGRPPAARPAHRGKPRLQRFSTLA